MQQNEDHFVLCLALPFPIEYRTLPLRHPQTNGFVERFNRTDIVKDLLKVEKTLNQVAAETGIHPAQQKEWKRGATGE